MLTGPSWLATLRDRAQRRLAFIEKQLSEFYSPMVGLRAELRAFSDLRVRLQREAGDLWAELSATAAPGPEAVALHDRHWPQFERLIEYDNKRHIERQMPAYRGMVDLFRQKLWLADDDTRQFYL